MNPTLLAALTIAVCAICTFITRVLPFALFGGRDRPPELIRYLGKLLPSAVISVLIVYCLKAIDFSSVSGILPHLISIAIVVALHLWKRNNLLSIGAGTVCYMLLVQFVF